MPKPFLVLALVSILYVSSSNARELKILNLNMWAVELPIPEFVYKSPSVDLEERIQRLPREIAGVKPDIIVFEEVWRDQRAEQIAALLKPLGYLYHVAASRAHGWLLRGGNGLLIASKLPLDLQTESLAFDNATRWDESFLICKKGALKTRVEVAAHQWIDLYATHLGATSLVSNNREFDRTELAAQAKQTKQLIDFINRTHGETTLILAADLNSHPLAFEDGHYTANASKVYDLLTRTLKLKDSAENTRAFTYDTVHNHYASTADFAQEPAGRIDFIFSKGDEVTPKQTTIEFTKDPISDHYGLLTTYDVKLKLRLPSSN